jgi:hypothetical protein
MAALRLDWASSRSTGHAFSIHRTQAIMSQTTASVVLLGGCGFFGVRLATLLSQNAALRVIVAGRDLSRAQRLTDQLRAQNAVAQIEAARIDSASPSLAAELRAVGAQMAVNLCGPFQGAGHGVAKACVEASVHYADLADGRKFVLGIRELDAAAKAAGVLVASGASSVPALSFAVAESLAADFSAVADIDVGISPGNKTERGLATVAAILSYCGEDVDVWLDGRWQKRGGWGMTRRRAYPSAMGDRWQSLCDVPDLTLLAERWPQAKNVVFRAGLELGFLHLGLAGLSAMRRARLLPNLARWARQTKAMSETLKGFGSDAGGMHVELRGVSAHGLPLKKVWTLVAEKGDGPFVPTLAAAALARKLAEGNLPAPQASPCVGMLDLTDFEREFGDLAITTQTETVRALAISEPWR